MKVSGFLFIYFYKLILRYNPAAAGLLFPRRFIRHGGIWSVVDSSSNAHVRFPQRDDLSSPLLCLRDLSAVAERDRGVS